MHPHHPSRRILSIIASFLNEWRDTIFYSVLASGIILNSFFAFGISLSVFANCAELREIARAVSWGIMPGRNIRYALMGVFVCECMFLARRFVFSFEDPAPLIHTFNAIFVLMHMSFAILALVKAGGVKHTFASYRDKLFDYPRKIKPPGKPGKSPAQILRDMMRSLKPALGRPVAEPA